MIATAAAALLGDALRDVVPLSGGDVSQTLAATAPDGRALVIKGAAFLGATRIEADMLGAIARSGAPAPAVIAADDAVLVIARLPSRGRVSGAWAALGRVVAVLHEATGPAYGWPDDYSFGPVPIPGAPAEAWPDFWAARRLLPHLPHLPPTLARRIETLAARLGDRLPAHPRPALLHGDLWGGNVLTNGPAISGLIDPACCYGHAEADFGMLTLFDLPDDSFWEAYGRPEAGFEERATLYRLWPALVHLRLFGGSYRGMVERLLDEAGA